MRLFKRPKLSPKYQDIYDKAQAAELRSIRDAREKAEVKRIEVRARADAARAATPTSSRVLGGLLATGKALSKKLENYDPEKFEAYVTGKPKKKA